MENVIHDEPSKYAGKTVRIISGARHPRVPNFEYSEFRVEDWWDRLGQGSWMYCKGNPACMIYAMRVPGEELPIDDEVLYGKIGLFGHIVHVNEIEEC